MARSSIRKNSEGAAVRGGTLELKKPTTKKPISMDLRSMCDRLQGRSRDVRHSISRKRNQIGWLPMSAKAAGRVWDLDLPHNKQHVLLAMADHADHEGRNMYPSLDLIAWKTGYSYRQVRRIVAELERDGILVVRKPARQQHPAVYDMDLSAGTAKPPFDRTKRKQYGQDVHSEDGQDVHSENPRVDISAPPEWTSETPRVDMAMSTKPTEPTMNHVVGVGTTLAFLKNEGVGAAKEFAQLPYESMKQDYDNRRADGQAITAIITAWRANPPTESYHYARPERSAAPDNTRGSARPEKRPRGSHNPSGGAELRDPGWQQREIDRITQLYPDTEV